MAHELWITKHRPRNLDEYVWRDPQMRETVEGWIEQKAAPHALFSGLQGTGKTSIALLLLNLLEIPDEDILRINASRERKVDGLQDKIINFINAWAFNPTGLKYVLLDEADKLSAHAQGMLRNEMETYADSCRFILTCNYANKIIPALHSRLQEIRFTTLNEDEFTLRIAEVLMTEGVEFDPDVLLAYRDRAYPDLRKCIGLLQQNSKGGKLMPPSEEEEIGKDYLFAMTDLFKKGRYQEARRLLLDNADPDGYDEVFRFLYQNLPLFGATQAQQDEALLSIRRAIVYDGSVAHRDINMAALFVELAQIAQPPV